MKHSFIFLIIIGIVISGVLLFKKNNLPSEQVGVKEFFPSTEILPADVVIKITSNGFEPATVKVKKGTRIVWINELNTYAWPASDPHPTHGNYSGFDPEEPFTKGEAWGFVFERPGIWAFHDHLSPGFKGSVEVTD